MHTQRSRAVFCCLAGGNGGYVHYRKLGEMCMNADTQSHRRVHAWICMVEKEIENLHAQRHMHTPQETRKQFLANNDIIVLGQRMVLL